MEDRRHWLGCLLRQQQVSDHLLLLVAHLQQLQADHLQIINLLAVQNRSPYLLCLKFLCQLIAIRH